MSLRRWSFRGVVFMIGTDTYLILWLLYVFDDIKDVNFGVQQAWVST